MEQVQLEVSRLSVLLWTISGLCRAERHRFEPRGLPMTYYQCHLYWSSQIISALVRGRIGKERLATFKQIEKKKEENFWPLTNLCVVGQLYKASRF